MIKDLFSKIITPTKDKDSIEIGEVLDTELNSIVNKWVQVVDWKVKSLEVNEGFTTSVQRELLKYRLFTFKEYKYLFLDLPEDDYDFYSAYRYLDINDKQERASILFGYEYSSDDYNRLIKSICPKDLMRLFTKNNGDLAKLKQSDLEKHAYFVGATGSGKTTLMATTIRKLIKRRKGYSFVVIDPHGDLSIRLSELKIDEDRLMFFTLKDFEKNGKIFSYNVFDIQENDDLNLGKAIEQIVDAISGLPIAKGHSVSAGMNSMLTFCLKFIFKQVPNPTILDLHKLVCLDPMLLAKAQAFDDYFTDRFVSGEKSTREAVRRRVENAIKNDVFKDTICSDSTFNLEQSINSNKVMLFDLSKLGVETQIAMGKFLIANIKNYVRKRNKNDLKNHTYMIVDEAQNFISKDIDYILAQLRGFGLHTFLASQYVNQLGENVEAIKYNTAVKVISGQLSSDFSNLMSIPKKFLKSYDNKITNTIDIKQYEFLVGIYGKEIFKIKSPNRLVKSRKDYRNEIDQTKFEENQYKKYYKDYNETQKSIVSIPKNELEPLKLTGDTMSLPEIERPLRNKDINLLFALSLYKYLTIDMMLKLKISSSNTNLPTSKLEKDKLIKSLRVQLDGSSTTSKVFFLTKLGAKWCANDCNDELRISYPTKVVKKLSQTEHKFGVINHAIELSRYELDFIHIDIQNSGKRNCKVTELRYDTNKIEPDMLFCIKTPRSKEYYTFEYERLKDSEKSFKKILQHQELIDSQSYQRTHDFRKQHRSLWVFEELSTLTSVMEKTKNANLDVNVFLFKLADSPINKWLNYNQETVELFYL